MVDKLSTEYFAVRSGCAVMDLTPMEKYRIRGPQSRAFLNRLVTRDLTKLGTHSFPTGEISFEDVRIPADALLGKLGGGTEIVFSSLNQTRLSCAAGAVGLAQACLDAATRHCNERHQFGQTVGKFQMNQEMIAATAAEIEAARLLTYRAAWQKDTHGGRVSREAAMAKLFATEQAQQVIDQAVQLHGGDGVRQGSEVESLYRDIRALRIYEGASDVQKLIIARATLAGA